MIGIKSTSIQEFSTGRTMSFETLGDPTYSPAVDGANSSRIYKYLKKGFVASIGSPEYPLNNDQLEELDEYQRAHLTPSSGVSRRLAGFGNLSDRYAQIGASCVSERTTSPQGHPLLNILFLDTVSSQIPGEYENLAAGLLYLALKDVDDIHNTTVEFEISSNSYDVGWFAKMLQPESTDLTPLERPANDYICFSNSTAMQVINRISTAYPGVTLL
jgi:hypothetical protein